MASVPLAADAGALRQVAHAQEPEYALPELRGERFQWVGMIVFREEKRARDGAFAGAASGRGGTRGGT